MTETIVFAKQNKTPISNMPRVYFALPPPPPIVIEINKSRGGGGDGGLMLNRGFR